MRGHFDVDESASSSDSGSTPDPSRMADMAARKGTSLDRSFPSTDLATWEMSSFHLPAKGRASKSRILETNAPIELSNEYECLEDSVAQIEDDSWTSKTKTNSTTSRISPIPDLFSVKGAVEHKSAPGNKPSKIPTPFGLNQSVKSNDGVTGQPFEHHSPTIIPSSSETVVPSTSYVLTHPSGYICGTVESCDTIPGRSNFGLITRDDQREVWYMSNQPFEPGSQVIYVPPHGNCTGKENLRGSWQQISPFHAFSPQGPSDTDH